MASISLKGVHKSFSGLEVIHGVDLEIEPGEQNPDSRVLRLDGEGPVRHLVLARPAVHNALSRQAREQLEIDAMYSGYLERQALDVEAFKRDEDLRLSADLDYASVGGLSNEVREKLAAARPVTLGQASRIEGVTAGALTALLAHVKRENRKRA